MFESLSYLVLQQYWWIIISLLAGLLVFLLFVQGGQTLIYTLGKNETEKSLLVNSLGRKWEFTFTTLVVFGGAFFASFPLFYSTSFGGAYWVWMSILFCFIVQAISYEFRSKPANFLGKKTFDIFLFINGAIGTILLGTVVATMFTGSAFSVGFANISQESNYVISQWHTPWRGLEALTNITNICLGIAVFFLARTLALLYFQNNINDENIMLKTKRHLWFNALPFVVFFLTFVFLIFFSEGYAYFEENRLVYLEKYKYFKNFIEMPLAGLLFVSGVVSVLAGIYMGIFTASRKGIWYSGAGVIITVFSLFINLGFNNTVFYPSNYDFQSSLTIENASSSLYTLTAMSYVSLLIPFVAAYMFYAWKAINNKPIDKEEMGEEGHIY